MITANKATAMPAHYFLNFFSVPYFAPLFINIEISYNKKGLCKKINSYSSPSRLNLYTWGVKICSFCKNMSM